MVLRASYGLSNESDGDQRKATLTAGTGSLADDGWNAFFSVDVGSNDAVLANERRDRKWVGTGDIRRWGYAAGTNRFLGGTIINGGTGGGNSQAGSVFDPTRPGQIVSLPGCAQLGGLSPADPGGGCLWDQADWRDLVPEEKYANLFARATFASRKQCRGVRRDGLLAQGHEFPQHAFERLRRLGLPRRRRQCQQRRRRGRARPDLSGQPSIPGRRCACATTPPTLAAATATPTTSSSVSWPGSRAVGAIGTTTPPTCIRAPTSVQKRTGFLRYSAVQCVLGDPACAYGAWNIGLGSDANPQSLYDYISPQIQADASSQLDSFDFKVSRSLYDLKGGPLAWPRAPSGAARPTGSAPMTYTDIGDIIGLGYSAYDGTQNVYAGYVELSAPVLETLELNAALRYDKYESGDSAAKPKVGFKWNPIDWFALRGTYAEGFRALNPAENGDGGLAAFSSVVDLVRCAAQPNPVNCSARNVAIITTPNPDLTPEESKSYSLGIVLQPTSSTSITLDAWRIKRTDEIAQGSTSQAIADGDVLRDSDLINGVPGTGTLLVINTAYVNANASEVEGIDADVRQDFALGDWGDLQPGPAMEPHPQVRTQRRRQHGGLRRYPRRLQRHQLHRHAQGPRQLRRDLELQGLVVQRRGQLHLFDGQHRPARR